MMASRTCDQPMMCKKDRGHCAAWCVHMMLIRLSTVDYAGSDYGTCCIYTMLKIARCRVCRRR